ncbi:hypothetical protein TNIN_167091 [Trichonephila inaurata madagascariensis]|uniref:Uncharacterized protein n=1 Tax=Trichonephila inaurata madagascariensis TaxID=2747483 RepID=A0A8X7CR51_9ARAC|nr:hypothetical protein TNIN_167091 [Trichonephila inaurata madagascariensis]
MLVDARIQSVQLFNYHTIDITRFFPEPTVFTPDMLRKNHTLSANGLKSVFISKDELPPDHFAPKTLIIAGPQYKTRIGRSFRFRMNLSSHSLLLVSKGMQKIVRTLWGNDFDS